MLPVGERRCSTCQRNEQPSIWDCPRCIVRDAWVDRLEEEYLKSLECHTPGCGSKYSLAEDPRDACRRFCWFCVEDGALGDTVPDGSAESSDVSASSDLSSDDYDSEAADIRAARYFTSYPNPNMRTFVSAEAETEIYEDPDIMAEATEAHSHSPAILCEIESPRSNLKKNKAPPGDEETVRDLVRVRLV